MTTKTRDQRDQTKTLQNDAVYKVKALQRMRAVLIVEGISDPVDRYLSPAEFARCDVDPRYQRGRTDMVNTLVHVLKSGGKIYAPVVLCERPGDDRLYIVDGHQRFLAHDICAEPMPVKIHQSTGWQAEALLFQALNYHRGLTSDLVVKSHRGPGAELLREAASDENHWLYNRIHFGDPGRRPYPAFALMRGLMSVTRDVLPTGKVQDICARVDHAITTDPMAVVRCRAFLRLVPRVFPYSNGVRPRPLAIIGLARVAERRWRGRRTGEPINLLPAEQISDRINACDARGPRGLNHNGGPMDTPGTRTGDTPVYWADVDAKWARMRLGMNKPDDSVKEYVKRHVVGQRPVSMATVKRYASDHAAKQWLCTGQPIVIDSHGDVIDGQHRLLAVILADVCVRYLVVEGIDPSARMAIDTGLTRTLYHASTITNRNHSRRVLQMTKLLLHRRLNRGPSNAECFDFIAAHRQSLEWVDTRASKDSRLASVAVLAILMRALYRPLSREKLEQFMRVLDSGITEADHDVTVIALRNKLLDTRRMARSECHCKTAYAVDAYMVGNKVSRLFELDPEKHFPLPEEKDDQAAAA